jgi:hypothetical protein
MFPTLLQLTAEASRAGSGFYSVALISALGPVAVAALGYSNHRKGKTRDRARKSEFEQLQETIAKNHGETTQQFSAVSRELVELRAFVVGPDGENGLRGDLKELKSTVTGLVERERERLEIKAYDRRRAQ